MDGSNVKNEGTRKIMDLIIYGCLIALYLAVFIYFGGIVVQKDMHRRRRK